MSTKPDLRVVCVHAPPMSPLGHFVSAEKRFTDEWCEGDRKATVADLVAALIAEGGEIVNKYGLTPAGSEVVVGQELRFPIPAEEETTT